MSIQSSIRTHFFPGRLLTAEDLQNEQEYVLGHFRRHNRFLHGWGVVAGLSVSVQGGAVVVAPGLAIDCAGNELVVESETTVALSNSAQKWYVALRYVEVPVGGVPSVSEGRQSSAIREGAEVQVLGTSPSSGHRRMLCGSPGCGTAHPVGVAVLSKRGKLWAVRLVNRLPARSRAT